MWFYHQLVSIVPLSSTICISIKHYHFSTARRRVDGCAATCSTTYPRPFGILPGQLAACRANVWPQQARIRGAGVLKARREHIEVGHDLSLRLHYAFLVGIIAE